MKVPIYYVNNVHAASRIFVNSQIKIKILPQQVRCMSAELLKREKKRGRVLSREKMEWG